VLGFCLTVCERTIGPGRMISILKNCERQMGCVSLGFDQNPDPSITEDQWEDGKRKLTGTTTTTTSHLLQTERRLGKIPLSPSQLREFKENQGKLVGLVHFVRSLRTACCGSEAFTSAVQAHRTVFRSVLVPSSSNKLPPPPPLLLYFLLEKTKKDQVSALLSQLPTLLCWICWISSDLGKGH